MVAKDARYSPWPCAISCLRLSKLKAAKAMTLCSAFKVPSPENHEFGEVLDVNSFVGRTNSAAALVVPFVSSEDARNGASLSSVDALNGALVRSTVGRVMHPGTAKSIIPRRTS